MSRHWKPNGSTHWLSPDAYRALSPAEKRALWRERQEQRRQRALSAYHSAEQYGWRPSRRRSRTGTGTWLSVVAIFATVWAVQFGVPAKPFQNLLHPSSAPVTASFGYCFTGGGTNCVVDGDTFWIGGEKVRIAGIDAPETHPPRCDYEAQLGEQATEKLHALLNSGAVTMTSVDRDRDVYGRLLRNVEVNGEDVGEAMVSAGVAREYAGGRRPWCS